MGGEKARERVDGRSLLRRVFAVVEAEAEVNAAFREKLVAELAAEIAALTADGAAPDLTPESVRAATREILEEAQAASDAAAPASDAKAPDGKALVGKASAEKPPDDEEEADELSGINPVALVEAEGPDALRDQLRFTRRKEPLARLAKAYGLDVSTKLLRKKLPVASMVEEIVTAAARRAREQALSAG